MVHELYEPTGRSQSEQSLQICSLPATNGPRTVAGQFSQLSHNRPRQSLKILAHNLGDFEEAVRDCGHPVMPVSISRADDHLEIVDGRMEDR